MNIKKYQFNPQWIARKLSRYLFRALMPNDLRVIVDPKMLDHNDVILVCAKRPHLCKMIKAWKFD